MKHRVMGAKHGPLLTTLLMSGRNDLLAKGFGRGVIKMLKEFTEGGQIGISCLHTYLRY